MRSPREPVHTVESECFGIFTQKCVKISFALQINVHIIKARNVKTLLFLLLLSLPCKSYYCSYKFGKL